jgi:hypothetical protein
VALQITDVSVDSSLKATNFVPHLLPSDRMSEIKKRYTDLTGIVAFQVLTVASTKTTAFSEITHI